MKQMERRVDMQQGILAREQEKNIFDEAGGSMVRSETYVVPPLRQQEVQIPTFHLEFPKFNGSNPRAWIR